MSQNREVAIERLKGETRVNGRRVAGLVHRKVLAREEMMPTPNR